MLNPSDLADLLQIAGFEVDYDTGEVFKTHTNVSHELLILLASLGKIDVGRDEDYLPTFFIPDLNISTIEQYCEAHPSDPQCKHYDV
tara:strand:+ start:370 stop:630 length:261 start_codon:yes stop_codon:yes gene_type:complete